MRILNNKAYDVKIAYIGGGSRGWAWGLMSDLAMDDSMNGTVCLYDICSESTEKNCIIGNKYSSLKDSKGEWTYTVAYNLADTLQDADFVIISILPGTFEQMRSDVHSPEKYGIYQPVGDTVGPGGFIRALRTVPMFVEIASAIKEHSPNAWVINYTNPMSVSLKALYTVFPEIKAFGCCHEVFETQKLLAQMLYDCKGIEATREDININVLGINHFTWIDFARYHDIDLLPIYSEFVKTHYDEGYILRKGSDWRSDLFASAERVKFDLFCRYGYIAAAGDRHLAEFCPGSWYLQSPESINRWRFKLTTVDWRVANLEEKLMRRERLITGEESVVLNATGEEGHILMQALLGIREIISNVNLPNIGQVRNLPLGTIVETNAIFRSGEIRPVVSGKVPENILGVMAHHVYSQEMTVSAAISCDKELAFSVFANDPLVTISLEEAKELFNTMISNTLPFLPEKWRN
ncbi:MAG: alpha-glucosidase/alpha-galactosidase [Oscillospiraceae bacterium]|nr:alpha-glucosidase/alpha-galactosidase [Oscillospiraceae bacterium]